MLKAQATKASRQREEKRKIDEYVKKIRKGEVPDEDLELETEVIEKKGRQTKTKRKTKKDYEELPQESPKLVRKGKTSRKYQNPESSESESSDDNEELVIQSRKIKKDKKNKSDSDEASTYVFEELAELKEMVSQLTDKKRKPRTRKNVTPRNDYQTEQMIPMQQPAPVVHILNTTATPHKETEAEKKIKETLLKFD
jgi:hypothetical protein